MSELDRMIADGWVLCATGRHMLAPGILECAECQPKPDADLRAAVTALLKILDNSSATITATHATGFEIVFIKESPEYRAVRAALEGGARPGATS